MTVPSDPMDVSAEVVEEVYNEFFKENNNDADIRIPVHVNTDSGDSADLHLQSGGPADQQCLDSADLGASKPVPESKPTLAQVKTWRNANFTVRHSTVNACGHKLDLRNFPSNANCWHCWEAFFSVSPDGVASVHDLLLTGGTKAVIAMHGAKFAKMFGKFLQKKLMKEYMQTLPSGIEGSIMALKEEANDLPNIQTQD